MEGLSHLLNTIRLVQKHLNKDLEIEGVLITMYDNRLNLSRQVVHELHEYFDTSHCLIVQSDYSLLICFSCLHSSLKIE